MKNGMQRIDRRSARPRATPCRHFVQDDSECKQVAALVDLLPKDLLRRHISHGPNDPTGKAHLRCGALPANFAGDGRSLRKAEIQDLYVAIQTNHDVLRLQIAVDYARAMRRAKRLQHLPGNLQATI